MNAIFCILFLLLMHIQYCHADAKCGKNYQFGLIVSHSDNKTAKDIFLRTQLCLEIEHQENPDSSFLIFDIKKHELVTERVDQKWIQSYFSERHEANLLIILTRRTDSLNVQEIQILQELIYYLDSGFVFIEFGSKTAQTSVLENSPFCWGSTTMDGDRESNSNSVLLCNDVDPSNVLFLRNANISTIEDTKQNNAQPSVEFSWANLFGKAMAEEPVKTDKKRPSKKTNQPSQRQLYYKQLQRDPGGNDDDQKKDELQITEAGMRRAKEQLRLNCKYRKSCYETGQVPEVKQFIKVDFYDWFKNSDSSNHKNNPHNNNNDDDDEGEIQQSDLQKMVSCKYRPSCYQQRGIDMSESNKKKLKGIFTAKTAAQIKPTGEIVSKKKSGKDLAKQAIKELEKRDKAVASNPTAMIPKRELKFAELEEKLKKKNYCKYRKSCYKSGVAPEIYSMQMPSWISVEPATIIVKKYLYEKEKDEIPFKEKAEEEQKAFCKYRKSCYDTGILPEIKEQQVFKIKDAVEQAKSTVRVSKELKCKYRKSCYETGHLTDFKAESSKTTDTAPKPKPIPATVEDLKLNCKYRKSCYRQKLDEFERNELNKKEPKKEQIVAAPLPADDQDSGQKEDGVVEEEEDDEQPAVVTDETNINSNEQNDAVKPLVERPKQTTKKSKRSSLESDEDDDDSSEFSGLKTKKSKKHRSPDVDEPALPRSIPKAKKIKSKMSGEKSSEDADPENDETDDLKTTDTEDLSAQEKLHEQEHEEIQKIVPIIDVDPQNLKYSDKYLCKYRKSCYQTGVPAQISTQNRAIRSDTAPKPRYSSEEWQSVAENKKKFHCKYRKSCYNDGNLPTVLTPVVVNNNSEKETDKTIQNFDALRQNQKKSACKYRKSCYESGLLPALDKPDQPQVKQHSDVDVDQTRASDTLQTRCKYRKSCYETGKLPTFGPASVETVIQSIKDNSQGTLQQKCKYRKSCYAENGATESGKTRKLPKTTKIIDDQTLVVKNVPADLSQKTKAEPKSSEKQQNEKSTDNDAKKQKKKGSSAEKKKKSSEDDEAIYKEIPQEKRESEPALTAEELVGLTKNMTTKVKLSCKYRHSCYEGVAHGDLPTIHLNKFKCSKYKISCREKLGLPPIEKAPIGPNGRKLCRKKPVDQ